MKKVFSLASMIFILCVAALGQDRRISKLEFRDKPLSDILLALGDAAKVSIVPDETVKGTGSYFFADMDFDTAIRRFAASFGLFLKVKDGITYVSRVEANYDALSGVAALQAEDVDIKAILRAFSKAIGKTIATDDLGSRNATIRAQGMPPSEILEVLIRPYPDLKLESSANYFYITKVDSRLADKTAAAKGKGLAKNGEQYSYGPGKGRFLDLIVDLFAQEGKDYSLLTKSDSAVEGLVFKDKSFDEALRLILEQGNADYTVAGSVFYIYDIQRKDVLKKLKATIAMPIERVSIVDLPSLLPPDFASSGVMRIDKATGTVLLSGSPEEIGPVQELIERLDMAAQGRGYIRFDLKNIKAKDAVGALPSRFSSLPITMLPDNSGFIVLVSDATEADLRGYISMLDRGSETTPINLKYIKSEDLLKNLPPSVSKENVIDAGNGTSVFFVGSSDKLRSFMEDLALIDRPKPQIRYDLLVVQYAIGEGFNDAADTTATYGPSSDGASSSILGSFGKLLNLNFDIVSAFGYTFAVNLNLTLTDDKAQVFADTTLNGTTGKDIKFQNTYTARYVDYGIDPTTGKQLTTGVTREVSSGLILNIGSWVSGDDVITMDVSTTFSENKGTSSGSTAPNTSERVVSTNVRTKSGKPVIIGGLRQRKSSIATTKIPVLGSIPLLGRLFQTRTEEVSDSEIIIYIVPHLNREVGTGSSRGLELERLYGSYVKGY